ncbi:MAG: helix-turn-helix domain-containing protein [Protaetiibacter sp.]
MLTTREAAAVVRELRTGRGWNQAELASAAGVSRSFIADLERGKPTLEAAKLFDVLQALGYEVAIRELATGELRW